jgi:outer membrane murein-binding lipoprotein Lpp
MDGELIISALFLFGGMTMEHRVSKLESDMVDVKTRLAVAESNIKDIREDISSIKNNTAWIIRLIIGAIIMAVLGFISSGGIK